MHTREANAYCLGVFDYGSSGTLIGGITFRDTLVQVATCKLWVIAITAFHDLSCLTVCCNLRASYFTTFLVFSLCMHTLLLCVHRHADSIVCSRLSQSCAAAV